MERRGLVTRTFRRLDPERQFAVIQAILDEAIARGPAGLNVRQVAGRAGLAVGSLYTYFPKREGLLAFAVELVRRGFVCLAPDVIGFGERIPAGKRPYHDSLAFYRKHPGWSFMGKMVWDVGRAVDYLETLPMVDPKRIGSIGHSHGAYGTLFAAAFEPRISAVSPAAASPRSAAILTERWSPTALFPSLAFICRTPAFPDLSTCLPSRHRGHCSSGMRPGSIFPRTENLDGLVDETVLAPRRPDELCGSLRPHMFPTPAGAGHRWLAQRSRSPPCATAGVTRFCPRRHNAARGLRQGVFSSRIGRPRAGQRTRA
jgi:hypothetical protein